MDSILESEDEITRLRNKVNNAISDMRDIDTRGGFESDDEVGAVFDVLKEIVYGMGNDNDKEK